MKGRGMVGRNRLEIFRRRDNSVGGNVVELVWEVLKRRILLRDRGEYGRLVGGNRLVDGSFLKGRTIRWEGMSRDLKPGTCRGTGERHRQLEGG